MKLKRISQDTKLTIQVAVSVLLILAGLVLLFMGFYAPRVGEIHDSILIAYGEVSTFAGSLLGIDYHYKYKTYIADEERLRKDNDKITE